MNYLLSDQIFVNSAGIVDKHIDSFYALGTLAQTVETWTSVGGMLAAMTPVIAFFIVAGSAYTFTSIASKLNGADHIDEKAMSPDVLKQAPMFTNSKGTYEGTNFGQIATGASDPSISMSQVASIMEQSAYAKMVEAQRAYTKEVAEARSITERAGNGKQFDETYGDGTIYSNGTNYQTGKNQNSAVSFSAGQGFDNVHSEGRSDVADFGGRVQATVGAMIGYMLGKNKNGNKSESGSGLTGGVEGKVQGSVDGGWRRSFTDTDSTSNKNTFGKGIQDNISKVANRVNSFGKNRNVNKNNSYGTSQNYAQTLGSDRLARLNKSRSDAIKATEQYNNVLARTRNVDTSQNLSAKAAVQAIGNNGDWSGLRKLIQNNNLGEIYNQKKAFLENQLRYSSDVAEKSALLLTAMESQNADCNNKAATMLGTAVGYQIPQPDSAKNKNIHDLEPNPNNVPSDKDINNTYDMWKKLADGGILNRKFNIDSKGNAVKDAYGTEEGKYSGLVNAEQKFKQFGNDINSIWKDAVMSISNVLKSNQGRHDFNETELLEDQEYLKSSFINSLGSSGISNIDENTKNKLFQLYTMGNAVNFSDNDIKKFVDLYTDAGIDNTAASQIIDTLRNSSGFQAGELTEDVEKNNAARYALFSALNAAKGQQAKYLREHKGDYDEIVKGFSINNGNPTEIANLNSN